MHSSPDNPTAQSTETGADATVCTRCGGTIQAGYLLGKHNRIRWSASDKGMTIFHGVPLITLEPGYWRRGKWWSYAPSIRAQRCRRCRLVTFNYNNDAREKPRREYVACLTFGATLLIAAIVLLTVIIFAGSVFASAPLVLRLALLAVALPVAAAGVVLLIHAGRYRRRESAGTAG